MSTINTLDIHVDRIGLCFSAEEVEELGLHTDCSKCKFSQQTPFFQSNL
jgi:hypothetical protein